VAADAFAVYSDLPFLFRSSKFAVSNPKSFGISVYVALITCFRLVNLIHWRARSKI
jgi:hypothetical protein